MAPILLPVIVALAVAVLGYLLYDMIKEPHSNPKSSRNSYLFEPLGGTTRIHNFGISLTNSPDGVVVDDVDSGSDAENNGVHPKNIISQINNKKVKTLDDIRDEIMYCASTYGIGYGIKSASVNLYIKGRKTPVRLNCQ